MGLLGWMTVGLFVGPFLLMWWMLKVMVVGTVWMVKVTIAITVWLVAMSGRGVAAYERRKVIRARQGPSPPVPPAPLRSSMPARGMPVAVRPAWQQATVPPPPPPPPIDRGSR
jgi:hypothetical protein